MRIIAIASISLLAFSSLLSLSSQYITVVNLRLLCSFAFLLSISVPTFLGQRNDNDLFKLTLLFLSPLFLVNENHINVYFILFLLIIYLISLVRFKFNTFGKSVLIFYILILFILTIGLFITDYLHQEYKNKDHIEENYIYSPNKQSLLKTKFIDEGGLGSSSSIILYKNLNSFFKQEIEFCYNKPNENIKWNNDDEFKLDEILVEIKRINFVLPRLKSGKCIDQLD